MCWGFIFTKAFFGELDAAEDEERAIKFQKLKEFEEKASRFIRFINI